MTDKRISFVFALAALTVAAFGGQTGLGAGLPDGWYGAGSHPQNYEMSVDATAKHGGQTSARIKFTAEKAEGFGTLMQMFKADSLRGKRVRMSAWMKTQEADRAQLWMRLDAENRMAGFDNMGNRSVTGTTEWKVYTIVLDVPEDTVGVAFGVLVAGKGQAWVDDFQFETVGNDVASTDMRTPEQMKQERKTPAGRNLPERAANLDFEAGTQPERKVAAVSAKVLGAYAGQYQTESGNVVTVVAEGDKLFFTSEQTPGRTEMLPQSETEFFIRYSPLTIIFVRDAEGRVTHTIRRLLGQDTIAKKIK